MSSRLTWTPQAESAFVEMKLAFTRLTRSAFLIPRSHSHKRWMSSKHVLNHTLITDLLQAILLPSEITVCKCLAHANADDPIFRGNTRADAAAKAVAKSAKTLLSYAMAKAPCPDAWVLLAGMQSFATPKEKSVWRSCGAAWDNVDKIWIGPNTNPCLPKHFFPHFAKLTHGLDHVSKGGMLEMINQFWFTKGFSVAAQKHCEVCFICLTQNAGRPIKMANIAAHPPLTRPFKHIMMDSIELSPSQGKKHCLVIVDMWSKWVEAFHTAAQTAEEVAKAFLKEIIPRWGILSKISRDNGTHFANEALTQIGELFGIDIRKHCAYHPASRGAVERKQIGKMLY